MNDRMKNDLNRQLSSVCWTAEDTRAVFRRMKKEELPVKRKLSVGALVAIALIFAMTVALAATNQAQLLDIVGRLIHSFVPDNAQTYMQAQNVSFENEIVSACIRESYYDGHSLRLAIDVTPKEENVLLIHTQNDMEQPWQYLITPNYADMDTTDTRTVQEVSESYSKVYRIGAEIESLDQDDTEKYVCYGSYVFDPETNVQTIVFQETSINDIPARNVQVKLTCKEVWKVYKEDYYSELISPSMTFTFEGETQTYVSTAPVEFPNAGVRVDRLLIEVKPLDIYATIEHSLLNENAKSANFLFIDPDANGADTQELHHGLSLLASATAMQGEQPVKLHILGRDELRNSYTLALWDDAQHGIIDTCVVPVQPVESK